MDDRRAVVTDTVIVKMIEESLTQPTGCLFPYRNVATGEYDHSGIWAVLQLYWSAVRETFPDAWGKPPTQSRLLHGVGIRSMGKLMDRIMATVDPLGKDAYKMVRLQLATIAPAYTPLTSVSGRGLVELRGTNCRTFIRIYRCSQII